MIFYFPSPRMAAYFAVTLTLMTGVKWFAILGRN